MADGAPVVQGSAATTSNFAQTPTTLLNDGTGGSDGTALYLFTRAPGDGLYSVAQEGSGVQGYSYRGDGVQGVAVPSGGRSGVHGIGYATAGVLGEDAGGGVGVAGSSPRGIGASGSGSGVGVFGEASDAAGFGVEGINRRGQESGFGVYGYANIGVWGDGTIGVVGRSFTDFGIGVEGDSLGEGGVGVFGATQASSGGVGVYATAPSADSSALEVQGRARFSSSGQLTVPAGDDEVTAAGVSLTAASIVLATLQQNQPGVGVRAAVPDVVAASVTIYLTQTVPTDTVVAWFVIN